MRVAVVGLGFVATRRHLPLWKKQGNVSLVGVCDTNEQAVQEATRRFKVPAGFIDVEQMIREAQPDIIDLCTPPRTHVDLAKLAMERGCHVILEKPMAVTYDECQSLVEYAAVSGRKLCVIHNMLFYPPVVRALELTRKSIGHRLPGGNIRVPKRAMKPKRCPAIVVAPLLLAF